MLPSDIALITAICVFVVFWWGRSLPARRAPGRHGKQRAASAVVVLIVGIKHQRSRHESGIRIRGSNR